MIISASRRTDIPAFYSKWFMDRVQEGYCTVFNPFNRNQVKYVSLKPKDVDIIVFWTKYSKALRNKLNILDDMGIKYYFQYTLNNYPKTIEPHMPEFSKLEKEFFLLSEQIGAKKIIWRYDPIIFSDKLNYEYHTKIFKKLSERMKGATNRVVISIIDYYKKTLSNLSDYDSNYNIIREPEKKKNFGNFIKGLVEISKENGLEIQSCSEPINLEQYGVKKGKCIDEDFIRKNFNIHVTHKKDPGQRKECGCVNSTDIGVYNTCLFGCKYCYATKNNKLAIENNKKKHDPNSPSLIGYYEAEAPKQSEQEKLF